MLRRFILIALGLGLLLGNQFRAQAAWSYLPQTAIKRINFSSGSNGLNILIITTGWFRYKTFYLHQKNGYYLIADLWPVYLPKGFKRLHYFKNLKIKLSQYNPRTVRAVIYLKKELAFKSTKNGNVLILNLPALKYCVSPSRVHKSILVKSACIKSLRILNLKDKSIIQLRTTAKPFFKDFELPASSDNNLPPRLVIDIWPAYLPKHLLSLGQISHPEIRKMKLAQFNKRTVRMVLYLKHANLKYDLSFNNNTLSLNLPKSQASKLPLVALDKKALKSPAISLSRVFNLKIKKIVIDPGHGGKDPGAIGYRGLKEKQVTLKIAKLVKAKLERHGFKVFLTRSSDRFISLDKRTQIANRLKADLFVSIHCNACPSHRLHGVETFFLGFTNDKRALQVAMRENATVNKRLSELDKILEQLLVHAKIRESAYLATEVENHVVANLKTRYHGVTELGVKQAPFYVLVGTRMPAILIETSFIDNPVEGQRLKDPTYLNLLAEGICKGIEAYIKKTEEAYRYQPLEVSGKGG